MTIYLEEGTQLRPAVAASEAIGAQNDETLGHEGTNLIDVPGHVVGRGNHGTLVAIQERLHVSPARIGLRMEAIPTLTIPTITPELGEARHAPDVRSHVVLVVENRPGLLDLA